ncbi:hypothetical protein [Paramicrobacterium agarici]|uniref:Uncharacterized protein n=1 Tax=Paramicrobacterium agarici TaxID=630514 RepID=A0A2A9DWJ8_9MICO|nr:hypothetical protein [Microbacterium agarici]PFG31167.1 hypothetical protein ATJ78_2120 [Microbacterium agarici]
MTSLSDEQPLSRRQRRERMRAQQAHDSVLQSQGSSEPDDAEADAPDATRDAANETADAASVPTADDDQIHAEQAAADTSESPGEKRVLTRRELRALRAETGSTAIVTPETSRGVDVPAAPASPAGAQGSPEAQQKKSAPAGRADKSHNAERPSAAKASPAVSSGQSGETASQGRSDAQSRPQLSPAFSAGVRDDKRPADSAARAFDTLVAPEARGSDAFTTSSVLILPGAPSTPPKAPASGTGEILVTGSVDLPRSASQDRPSSTDHSEIDSGSDNSAESPATAGTPVSATRAVSTHAVSRDVITPPTKASNSKLLMILAITAGVLCVAVIGVVIVGLMTGSF